MPDRRFNLPASPEHVFPGSQIDNARLYHDDIAIETDASGITISVPESVDPETRDEAVFYITSTLGFFELER